MGRWGEQLFAGDADLDEVSYISSDAGIELYNYEIGSQMPGALGLEATRAHLNSGVLSRLFTEYATKPTHGVSRELRYVFLGALAMRIGATLSPVHLSLLQTVYLTIPVSPRYSTPLTDTNFRYPAKKQFEHALLHYKNNGTPYDFEEARCNAVGCGRTAAGGSLRQCSKCRDVVYCDRACQAAEWAAHKQICKKPRAQGFLLNV